MSVYSLLAEVEMLTRATKLATIFGGGMTLSNLLKAVIKLRAGRYAATMAKGSVHAAVALRAVFHMPASAMEDADFAVESVESGRAGKVQPIATSMYDACGLGKTHPNESTSSCHLDEIIGLNYYGAV